MNYWDKKVARRFEISWCLFYQTVLFKNIHERVEKVGFGNDECNYSFENLDKTITSTNKMNLEHLNETRCFRKYLERRRVNS